MARIDYLDGVFGRYRCIYLDPPWPYERRPLGRNRLHELYKGGVMNLEEIEALPIRQLGHSDMRYHVFMWCTWPKMRDKYHLRVFEAWQLNRVSELVWNKELMGTGRRFRKQTEILLVGIPDDASPSLVFQRKDQRDLISAPSIRGKGKHSSKPSIIYPILASLVPGPRIELFARRHPPNWDVWGFEAPRNPTSES